MTPETETIRGLVVERAFAHPPEKLWRALTQPHLIAEWLMRNDFAPEVGHRFRLTGEWGGVAAEVLAIEPGRLLSWRWDNEYDDPAYAVRSVVTFRLTPTEGGTLLSMEQRGFTRAQDEAFDGSRHGWEQHFDRLGTVLAQE